MLGTPVTLCQIHTAQARAFWRHALLHQKSLKNISSQMHFGTILGERRRYKLKTKIENKQLILKVLQMIIDMSICRDGSYKFKLLVAKSHVQGANALKNIKVNPCCVCYFNFQNIYFFGSSWKFDSLAHPTLQ